MMKKFIINILPVMLFCAIFCSCEKWTEVEADNFETPERSAEYYANLRLWKATAGDRQVSFGWFGGWNGEGASMVGSLAGLPDSLDMVSIWGDWKTMTDARQKDLKYVQQVKGTKVMATLFTQSVGQGITPDGVDLNEYWGWNPSATSQNAEPNDEQKVAIRKYAAAIADTILSLGYDGLDIDFEGDGDLMRGQYRWKVFIEELGKYLGPKSGTGKLLALDFFGDYSMGNSVSKEIAPYFDWFINQAYAWQVGSNYTVLNNRLGYIINSYASEELTVADVAKKFIVTDSFEHGQTALNGGLPFTQEDGTTVLSYTVGMAAWEPLINGKRYAKGGSGVYHIEYGYTAAKEDGFYPFTRRNIQIMNPASKKGN
ncbi:MAG: glycoside hydrolase family 18 [Prevotella sp.]|jgi:hypothetical protein|nr:glycoside hydrolase family 18 [Prevotella sp.]